MTVFDIVCGLLLAVGAWKGWRDGIIVQLSGILGLLVGVYLGPTVTAFPQAAGSVRKE